MRKEYGKIVKETFLEHLKKVHPAITQVKVKLIRGDTVSVIPTTSPMISGYIVLVPDHRGRDQFAIEIGWSTKGRFPELPMRPSGRASSTRTEFQKDEFLCRLCNLWTTKDYWWGQDDPGGSRNGFTTIFAKIKYRQEDGVNWQSRAIKLAADAVDQFDRFGIPYLDEYFASKQVCRLQGVTH
jgi:hypothetical protein